MIVTKEAGTLRFQRYYSFMDESNTYHNAAILDPRFKHKRLEEKAREKRL